MIHVILKELSLKGSDKAKLLSKKFPGRIFRLATSDEDSFIMSALDTWSEPVQLMIRSKADGTYELVAREQNEG